MKHNIKIKDNNCHETIIDINKLETLPDSYDNQRRILVSHPSPKLEDQIKRILNNFDEITKTIK